MNQGVRTIIYPVKDMARAKTRFRMLLGVEPDADQPYYVGFKVGDQDIGLVPNGTNAGMTAFYPIADIKQSLQSLLAAASQILQEIKDVGGGRLIASVRDPTVTSSGLFRTREHASDKSIFRSCVLCGHASNLLETFSRPT